MKSFYQIALAFLTILFLVNTAQADIIRVNNEAGANADYDNAQTAHDNAMAGDTLHIEPSALTYGTLTMSKELTLIGNGYFLEDNLGLQANPKVSRFEAIVFNAGSENSKMTGLTIHTGIRIKTNDITVERNHFLTDYGPSTCCNRSFGLEGDVTNIYILQNYLQTTVFSFNGIASFVYMFNNIFLGSVSFQTEDTDLYFVNNTMVTITISNALVRNNILRSGAANIFNSVVENNMSNSTQFPPGDGNLPNIPMNTVFNLNCDVDAQFLLRPNSPALGAGFYGGEDMGPFDVPPGMGYVPYKLSGIPSVPSIYELEATVNGNNLDVIISTRSNN